MRWGSLSSLPATRNHHVLRLCALPPDPPPTPGQSLWPGLWVPHPQLPCHLYYLNLSTATSLPTQTSSAVCFPSLINTFPSFSCCHLSQLTAELLEKVTSTHCLLLHLPITPQPQNPPPASLDDSWCCHNTMTLLSPTDARQSTSSLTSPQHLLSVSFPCFHNDPHWVPSYLPGRSSVSFRPSLTMAPSFHA